MLEQARALALAPISHFRVGALAQGLSGSTYLGFNLEFLGLSLQHSVHAEQAALAQAHAAGEMGLLGLAISAPPCGHCRQFLNEAQIHRPLSIHLPGSLELELSELLPHRFGPSDLGQTSGFLEVPRPRPSGQGADLARSAAQAGWAPYSGTRSGLALRCGADWFPGCYLENAAFNPSLNPLQYALILARRQGYGWEQVEEIHFWEEPGPISLRSTCQQLAHTLPRSEAFGLL